MTDARARSFDGVEIAYTAAGAGGTALVFIHGGLACREFWASQMDALACAYRVVALDLAGHGGSGAGRARWTIRAFGEDARAVVEALGLQRVVLVGNSLGGPVALEAARLLPGRVVGVVGIDTLHDVTVAIGPEVARARAAAFRDDFAGSCRGMVTSLFHPEAHPALRTWVEERMRAMSPDVVAGFMEGFAGYDVAAACRAAGVPLRAIVGDLWPIDAVRNRLVVADFDAVVMKGCGHYPMLERPEEFNRLLVETVRALVGPGDPAA
jgi:pimeloyl-ACP methyl ester carboxylesterase